MFFLWHQFLLLLSFWSQPNLWSPNTHGSLNELELNLLFKIVLLGILTRSFESLDERELWKSIETSKVQPMLQDLPNEDLKGKKLKVKCVYCLAAWKQCLKWYLNCINFPTYGIILTYWQEINFSHPRFEPLRKFACWETYIVKMVHIHSIIYRFYLTFFVFSIWDWVPRSTSLPSHPMVGGFDLVSQMY